MPCLLFSDAVKVCRYNTDKLPNIPKMEKTVDYATIKAYQTAPESLYI
jgi:hypothetical protein